MSDEYTIETIDAGTDSEGRAVRIRIVQDDDTSSANPREDDGNLGVIYAPHRRYNLGDHGSDEYDVADRAREHFTEYANRGGLAAFERWLRIFAGATVVLRVGLIDHSGLSMYVGGGPHYSDAAGWDSGTVGVIFDLPSTREERGLADDVTTEDVEGWLAEEVKAYDAYLRGNVVGYVVERQETWRKDGSDDERTDWETLDSAWGFLIVEHERDMAEVRGQATAMLPEEVSVKA